MREHYRSKAVPVVHEREQQSAGELRKRAQRVAITYILVVRQMNPGEQDCRDDEHDVEARRPSKSLGDAQHGSTEDQLFEEDGQKQRAEDVFPL